MGVYQIGEVIKKTRESMGMTQEELSDGICSIENLSRIENGKCVPNRVNFKMLMERMGKVGERYLPFIHSNNIELYLQGIEIERLLSIHKYEEAEQLLFELEKRLDLSDRVNMQYTIWIHTLLDSCLLRISYDEGRKELMRALRCTIPSFKEEDMVYGILSQCEVKILCNIAVLWGEEGKLKEAIKLLEKMEEYFDRTSIDREERSLSEALVLSNLAKYLGQKGDTELAESVGERCRELCVYKEKASILSEVLYNIGYEKEISKKDSDKCKELFLQAYYVAELVGDEREMEKIKKHLIFHYGYIL